VNAQLSENADYAKTKNIKDVKGKVIGKMTVIPGLRTEVVLKSCIQKKDSAGRYSTEYTFVTPNHLEATNVTLVLQFYRSFQDVYFDTEGEADNIKTTIADNKLGTSFQTSRLDVDAVIVIRVISKKRAFVTITGISGQLAAD
jgi:hypothetical protein